jgi:hypothetical protein
MAARPLIFSAQATNPNRASGVVGTRRGVGTPAGIFTAATGASERRTGADGRATAALTTVLLHPADVVETAPRRASIAIAIVCGRLCSKVADSQDSVVQFATRLIAAQNML